MELWACGFNAWNQLQFEGELLAQPEDLHEFRCIFADDHIDILRASLSATLVQASSGVRTAGFPDGLIELLSKSLSPINVASAGNEKISSFSENSITQYDSFQKYLVKDGYVLGEFEKIKTIVANQTSFTALSNDGAVWTWGDGRYEACLGRETSEDSPASTPCIIHDLTGLPTGPVIKIVSGGYITAALTDGADAYIWGGRSGQSKIIDEISGWPMPLDLDGKDILDIAVGNDHLMVLTTEHEIFVVGEGSNGQLGMTTEKLTEWKQIALPLRTGQKAVAIFAGYKNSFVLVKEKEEINGT